MGAQRRTLSASVRPLFPTLRKSPFAFSREVEYHGRKASQFVAQSEIILHRAARLQRKEDGGKRRVIKGRSLPVRLVVSEVRDGSGQVLAIWLLLTNVPRQVEATTVALWYYWRWRIDR